MAAIGHCQLLMGELQLLESNQGGWVGSGQCSIPAQTPSICIIRDPKPGFEGPWHLILVVLIVQIYWNLDSVQYTDQGTLENLSGPKTSKISMNMSMISKGRPSSSHSNVDDDDADYALGEEVS